MKLRTVWTIGLFAGWWALAATTQAARAVRVYDVTVESSGAAAFTEAMRIVIVRATGQRDADRDPELQTLIQDARRYAQVVRAAGSGGTSISFDGGSVERALRAAGRTIWPRERPVVWVALDGADGEGESLRTRLEKAAESRGLPIMVQTVRSEIPVSSRDAALAQARGAGADYALLVRGVAGRVDSQLWVPEAAESRFSTRSWNGDPIAAIHSVADSLADSSVGISIQPELEIELDVEGVSSLKDYADITRAFTSAAGVKSVVLLELGNNRAAYRLIARGGEESLQMALSADGRFAFGGRSMGRLSVVFRR